MAISMSRKKSRASKKAERQELCSCFTIWFKLLYRIPAVAVLLILIFLWSSSTTIISGNIVHVCISSRKLNNLYCLSAGSQPNFEIPIPSVNNSSISSSLNGILDDNSSTNGSVSNENTLVSSVTTNKNVNEIVNDVKEEPNLTVTERINNNRDEELENAKKVVKEELQLHRSWMSNTNPAACDGRGIYVYDLPSKFNKDLLGQCREMIPWTDFCKYFDNEAFGKPIEKLGKGWYLTHQYSLEPIFHSRILKHPCRVYNENEAKLFYVPYYGGLDILRWHFKNVSNDVKDTLALELLKWLESRKTWLQNSGKDHVFVLGKISWDFRRKIDSSWGTRFLQLQQMQNPVKLLIERQPWDVNDIGIPHPTFFHPHSDDDIVAWQLKIIRTTRKNLLTFAGAARPDQPESIRSILINQCTSAGDKCKFLNCKSGGCDRPETIIELFAESEFCLQPPGDSPTRKSVFDSLISGCIPVLFNPFTAYYQYPWHLPEDHSKYSVFIDQEEVRQMKVNAVERLMNVSIKEREDMRRYIVYELLPGLVYGDSSSQLDKFQDAFSITVNNLLERVNRLQ
ncbi:xyloglucan-specific galacturonosyltransferase 1 [Ricinus communis]|uniref:Xyloglucan galactosyltransferase KATAMARI1, putative n=1 Tax=Ricinus communis TaxID=3988 RepID=B9RCA5_RICCO|nr:xyloglucan-specific galacturonosyltransferase 1 [Ricinus communis]EEF51176.1 Xyloglucan galactosyltransferase KATAMARI1, putative [Ricinus communis]|eukprot:XP_002509789.1 xyloglucan-specific galacturonosyltransferase 1 [Ricinus communis]